MRYFASVIALGLGLTSASYAGTVTTYPQYTDSETTSDSQSAPQTAQQQATNMANSQCIGNVVNSVVISAERGQCWQPRQPAVHGNSHRERYLPNCDPGR